MAYLRVSILHFEAAPKDGADSGQQDYETKHPGCMDDIYFTSFSL